MLFDICDSPLQLLQKLAAHELNIVQLIEQQQNSVEAIAKR
jgi:hypothetical protein